MASSGITVTFPATTSSNYPNFAQLYASRLDYELGTNDSAVLFTTVRRKACINEGLREFADLTECWQRESTITCSNGVATYNLLSTVNVPGADFLRITGDGPTFRYTDAAGAITYVAGDDLPRRQEPWLNAAEPGWQGSTGATTPSAWYLSGKGVQFSLGLVPPPSIGTSASAAVVLPYLARPSSLVDDIHVAFTDTNGMTRGDLVPYHQAFVHFAAHRLELLRKDTGASDRQLQKFLGYVQRFLQAQRQPAGQTIRPARFYFRDAARRRDEASGLRAPWWR